jgi:energy-coupling factor transporter ATP-binding protein EcfA2
MSNPENTTEETATQRQANQNRTVNKKTISFPKSKSNPEQSCELECQTSIVVIGPNGAGKSRLGAWIEMEGPQKERVHRITAQRSIAFPESTSPISMQAAREDFHWAKIPANWDRATFEKNKTSLRTQSRYGGQISNAITAPLNDINKLITLLFSENYTALLKRENEERKSGTLLPPPDTLIRQVQNLWEQLLPHRQLIISSGDVQAQPIVTESGYISAPYPAKAMSDGERVIFYLIGQCLCAPANAIILVDEPEIHLHKAIQDTMWNSIEKARTDCTFIYLTHDLTFATDRIGATKVCLTEYSNNEFSWFEIESQAGIPDDVFFEVLGSRKPVLFVEGTSGSIDIELYQLAYPDFTIKPAGGCSNVISATKAFRDLTDLHNLRCFGLIDRDYLEPDQIAAYERNGIYTPNVAEVENLFLIPELILEVAKQLILEEQDTLSKVKKFIATMFEREIQSHVMKVTHQRITLLLGQFSPASKELESYHKELKSHFEKIDALSIHNEALEEAQQLIKTENYEGILRVFNKKGIADQIAHLFDIRRGTYIEKIREMSKREIGRIPEHLRIYLPDLNSLL